MAAGDVVRLQVRVTWAVEIAYERDPFRRATVIALGTVARVESDPVTAAQLAQPGEKLALATADFQRRHAGPQRELLNLVVADLVEELEKPWRERLRFLVGGAVLVQGDVKASVADEAAVLTEDQLDVAARKGERLFSGGEQETAMRRYIAELIERLEGGATTRLAGQCGR